ncbi:MAG: hypothetical protein DMF86_04935 [Acidobacteria bacterium]|nr:MAG: hypothetical protein DMF86_04935 [Acidobacteriota bacterium]
MSRTTGRPLCARSGAAIICSASAASQHFTPAPQTMAPPVARGMWIVLLLSLLLTLPTAAQQKDWPSERPPRPLAAHSVKFPPYAFKTLSNGLQVIAVSHHEQPAVSLRLILRAGGAQDPENRPGVASLAASLLDQGTTSKNAEQIATTIDSIGGALGTGAGVDLSFINCVVMKDSLDVGLNLVADIAQHPAFAKEEIDRQRQQILSGLKVSYDDPDYLADMVFDRLVYGFHPYGRPQSGTPESIAAIGRDDLVAFHRKWFGANNAILAIVGDVEPDEAFGGAERALGKWGPAGAQVPKPSDPPPPTRRLVIIDRPGAVQTEIRVGNVGIPRKHDDFMALDLATKILGGEGANRLHRVLRTERGLTYGASADMHALAETGDIVAQTNTRSETTGETLRLMVDEVWKLLRDRVSERELGDAQAYLTGSFPLTIETPSQIALQILNAVFYGLDLNQLQTYRERVNAVSVDDVQRVARLYLHPDRLTIVLVGDASSFVKQLPGAGFDKFERISVADLDLSSVDLRRHAAPAAGRLLPVALSVARSVRLRATLRRTAVASEAVHTADVRAARAAPDDDARALIERAIAAKGGLARLRKIRTTRVEAIMRVQAEEGPLEIPTVTSIEYPDRFRVEAQMAGGAVVQVYAGGEYWVQGPRGLAEVTPARRDEIQRGVQRDIVRLLLRAHEGAATATAVSSPDPALAAVTLRADGTSPVTMFIDRGTGLIARLQYKERVGGGMTDEEYSDYRAVDGIQVPFRTVVRRPDAPVIERVVKDVRYNTRLTRGLFTKPGD